MVSARPDGARASLRDQPEISHSFVARGNRSDARLIDPGQDTHQQSFSDSELDRFVRRPELALEEIDHRFELGNAEPREQIRGDPSRLKTAAAGLELLERLRQLPQVHGHPPRRRASSLSKAASERVFATSAAVTHALRA